MDVGQAIGRVSIFIEQSKHVVEGLVMEEQASRRQAHRRDEVEASEMRQRVKLLEQQPAKSVDASDKL
eukprot:12889462-Prorocentrum_lima.AAC.1